MKLTVQLQGGKAPLTLEVASDECSYADALKVFQEIYDKDVSRYAIYAGSEPVSPDDKVIEGEKITLLKDKNKSN